MCFPSYRQQGLLIARGWPLVDMMNQIYSNRATGCRASSCRSCIRSSEAGFFSISGNLDDAISAGGRLGDGAAVKGDTRIAAAWCGEGSTAEGDFHSA